MKTEGYTIKDLELLSGIKMHTIRIWEKRYNLLNPDRTDTNIRRYDDNDLRRLLNISLLTKSGIKISKVARWEKIQIKEKVLEITETKTSDTEYVDRFLIMMINFDNFGFEKLLKDILDKYDFEEAYFNIFFKLFERVGTYWQVGALFPAQEHYVINIFRQKIIAAIDQLDTSRKKSSTMVFFLSESELHEMSLLFYSYLAQKQGYNVIYLGQLVPFEDLEKLNSIKEVDFVFTAFVNSITKPDLEYYLSRLKSTFQKQKIFITGYQVQNIEPALPRNVKVVKNYKEFLKFLR